MGLISVLLMIKGRLTKKQLVSPFEHKLTLWSRRSPCRVSQPSPIFPPLFLSLPIPDYMPPSVNALASAPTEAEGLWTAFLLKTLMVT